MDLSCIEACFKDPSYISSVVSISIICFAEENNTKDVLERVTLQNNTTYTVTLSISTSNATLFICDHVRHVHSSFQAAENTTNFMWKITGKYLVYLEDKSHIVLMYSEDRHPPLSFSFEIRIENVTGLNRTLCDGDCQHKAMWNHSDYTNVSLQLERHIPYYEGTLGIIWLSLISLIFLCCLTFVGYKIIQDNKTTPSTLYKRKISGIKRDSNKEGKKKLPKVYCLKEKCHTCGVNMLPRIQPGPMQLPVIAEHMTPDSK